MFGVHSKRKEKSCACWLVSTIKEGNYASTTLSLKFESPLTKITKYPKVTTVDEDVNLSWSIFSGLPLIAEMLYNFPESTILPVIQGNFYYTCILKRVALQHQSFHSNVMTPLSGLILVVLYGTGKSLLYSRVNVSLCHRPRNQTFVYVRLRNSTKILF